MIYFALLSLVIWNVYSSVHIHGKFENGGSISKISDWIFAVIEIHLLVCNMYYQINLEM